MKIWMTDLKNEKTDERRYMLSFAPHVTAARQAADEFADDDVVEDVFEVDVDDSRWDGLVIIGQLKRPERF